MKIILGAVKKTNEEQAVNRDTAKCVHKSWTVIAAYDVAASLAVALGIAGAIFLFAVLGISKHGGHDPMPAKNASILSLGLLAVVWAIAFIIQLIGGPFVFTKDVVCRKCHTRLKVNRRAFFSGRYARPPRCECGGRIEPAFLWKPE